MPFTKGHKLNIGNTWNIGKSPWNKGLIGVQVAWNKNKKVRTNTGRTHFKKGHQAPITAFKKGQTAWNKGKKFLQISGEKSYLWKGGITPINQKIRTSLEYKLWRESVFKRDEFTCQDCKKTDCYIHAHHIKPFAYFPELRFAIDNGITLCIECHKKTDTYAGKLKKK